MDTEKTKFSTKKHNLLANKFWAGDVLINCESKRVARLPAIKAKNIYVHNVLFRVLTRISGAEGVCITQFKVSNIGPLKIYRVFSPPFGKALWSFVTLLNVVWCGGATALFQIRQCWGALIPSWWTPRFASNNFQHTTSSFGESEKNRIEDSESEYFLKSHAVVNEKTNTIRWKPSWSSTIRSAGFVLPRQSQVAMSKTSSASSEGSQTALHHDWGQGVRQWQSRIVKN